MDFNRDINVLYMLKRKGYYCFIHQSDKGKLYFFSGGVMNKLDMTEKNYYYNEMDFVIAKIREPLDKYTRIQKQISSEVKSIGGSGQIHGAIVDIDFYNHIFVNPVDLKITGYWALDMVEKKVYTSIPELLETNCPLLYKNYLKRISEKGSNGLMIYSDAKKERAPKNI